VKQGSDGQRLADMQVMVEAGQTAKATLELLR
jgi:hypothetical protein